MTLSTSRTKKAKWRLSRALLYGLLLSLVLFATSNMVDGGKDLSIWLHARPAEMIGYFGGQLLFLPILFAAVAFIRNRFAKIPKSKSGAAAPEDNERIFEGDASGSTRAASGERIAPISQARPKPGGNFVVRYWRGGYSLAAWYWGFNLLVGVAAIIFVESLNGILPSDSDYEPFRSSGSSHYFGLALASFGLADRRAVAVSDTACGKEKTPRSYDVLGRCRQAHGSAGRNSVRGNCRQERLSANPGKLPDRISG